MTSGVTPPAALKGFAHIGIIVPEVQTAAALFRERLDAEVEGPQAEEALGLSILWVRVGGVLLEFVAPATPESRATAAIERGETGVHHVAFEVDGLDDVLAGLIDAGVPVRDTTPRPGSHNSRVVFLDPAASGGALIELMEHPNGH